MNNWHDKIKDLEARHLSIHVEKNNKVIFESTDPMLKPLFIALTHRKTDLKNATVVDKIVGRAAAYLCAMGQVKEVITPLASEAARDVLKAFNIPLYAKKMIPHIVNRDGTGMCPMEQMAETCNTPEEFFSKLQLKIKL